MYSFFPNLKELYLRSNNMSDDGLIELFTAFRYIPKLKKLDISHGEGKIGTVLGTEALKNLSENIKELDNPEILYWCIIHIFI